MRIDLIIGAAFLSLTACSSSDKDTKGGPLVGSNDAAPTGFDAAALGNCHPDPALGARRDACEFDPGATVLATIGNCSGNAIPIEHIVVIMQENRSFDSYFGHLPGHGQDDVDVPSTTPSNPDPTGAPLNWYHEAAYCIADTDHGWDASHTQWNGGLMDGFATSNAGTLDPTGARAMGYYDQTDIPYYYGLASTFATSDKYFCSLLGPTYPNRMFFYGGTSYGIVRTVISQLAPPGVPQLPRALSAKGVTWTDYRTNLASILMFPDFATAAEQVPHTVPADQFVQDAANGTLPQVSFLDSGFSLKAYVETDEHPPADMQLGQHWVWEKIDAIMKSPLWPSTAVFITYDEHGGLYDHVSPPSACAPDATPPSQDPELGAFDRLGFRVPLIVVSPWAKRHFVSHEVHSHTSLLRFIQAKFDLPAMTKRDANSDAMLDLFDFDHAPRLDIPELQEPPVDADQIAACQTAFP